MAFTQGHHVTPERTLRSVFVGNIPYEATEEQLKDIFSEVGPIVSFKLVYDRDTGKPKGYGFCEYKDQETASSAMRNLANIELYGRTMRVDTASNEKNREEFKQFHQPSTTTLNDSRHKNPQNNKHFVEKVNITIPDIKEETLSPEKAPEAITKAVASLPPEQMFELMKQMKTCIQNNPNEARNMLLQNPQLAYALLQAQIMMEIIDPKLALNFLHKDRSIAQLNMNVISASPGENYSNNVYSNVMPSNINSNMYPNPFGVTNSYNSNFQSPNNLYNSAYPNMPIQSLQQPQMAAAFQDGSGVNLFIPPPPNLPILSASPNTAQGLNDSHTPTNFIEPPPFLMSQKLMETAPDYSQVIGIRSSKSDTMLVAKLTNPIHHTAEAILPPAFLTMGGEGTLANPPPTGAMPVVSEMNAPADADLRDLFPGFGGADIDMRSLRNVAGSNGKKESSRKGEPTTRDNSAKRQHSGSRTTPLPTSSSKHGHQHDKTGSLDKNDNVAKKSKISGSSNPTPGPEASAERHHSGASLQNEDKAALIRQVLQLTNEQIGLLPPDQQRNIILLKEQILKGTNQI